MAVLRTIFRCRILTVLGIGVVAASMTSACKYGDIRQPAGQLSGVRSDAAAYDVLGLTRAKVCYGTEMEGYESWNQGDEGIANGVILIQSSPGKPPELTVQQKIAAGYLKVITLGAVDLEEILQAQAQSTAETNPLIASQAWQINYGSVGVAVILAAHRALAKVEGADAFVISRVSAINRWFLIFPLSSCADVSGVALRIKPAAQAARGR